MSGIWYDHVKVHSLAVDAIPHEIVCQLEQQTPCALFCIEGQGHSYGP